MTDVTITAPPAAAGRLTTSDGVPLKTALARATRRQRIRAFLLVLPLLAFITVTFLWPIVSMLHRSIYSPVFSDFMPRVSAELANWDGKELPPEPAWEALVKDLQEARKTRDIGKVATAVNYEWPAARSLFTSSARKADRITEGPYKDALIAADAQWDDIKIWALMKQLSSAYTARYYIAAVDKTYNEKNEIVWQPEQQQIYLQLFWRTLVISMSVTLACLFLGYPVAYILSVLPLRTSNLLMIMVLLPFWTSLLVRTTAWIALLQTQGVINDILVFLRILDNEGRIQLIFNSTGTIIAMTHILLPFMILPLYSVMKTIPPSYMRAARSLGATGTYSFIKVYFPQTLPGIGAGTLLVFILAMGYYITPALVGGSDGLLISNLIADHIKKTLNWSLGSALGAILLVIVLVFYWIYNKLIGVDNLKFG